MDTVKFSRRRCPFNVYGRSFQESSYLQECNVSSGKAVTKAYDLICEVKRVDVNGRLNETTTSNIQPK